MVSDKIRVPRPKINEISISSCGKGARYVGRFEIKFLAAWKEKELRDVVHLIAVWTEPILDMTCSGPYHILNIPTPSLMPVMRFNFCLPPFLMVTSTISSITLYTNSCPIQKYVSYNL